MCWMVGRVDRGARIGIGEQIRAAESPESPASPESAGRLVGWPAGRLVSWSALRASRSALRALIRWQPTAGCQFESSLVSVVAGHGCTRACA